MVSGYNEYQYLNYTIYEKNKSTNKTDGVNNDTKTDEKQIDIQELLDIAADEGFDAFCTKLREYTSRMKVTDNDDGSKEVQFKYGKQDVKIKFPKEDESLNVYNKEALEELGKSKGWEALWSRIQELNEAGTIKGIRGPIIDGNKMKVKFSYEGKVQEILCDMPKGAGKIFKKESELKSYLTSNDFIYSILATKAVSLPNQQKMQEIVTKIANNHTKDWYNVTHEQLRDEFINEIFTSAYSKMGKIGNQNKNITNKETQVTKGKFGQTVERTTEKNQNGDILKVTDVIKDKDGNVVSTIETANTYNNGKIDTSTKVVKDGSGNTVSEAKTKYQYNSKGNIAFEETTTTDKDGKVTKTIVTYNYTNDKLDSKEYITTDADNKVVSKRTERFNRTGKNDELKDIESMEYDKSNNITKQEKTVFGKDGEEYTLEIELEYDDGAGSVNITQTLKDKDGNVINVTEGKTDCMKKPTTEEELDALINQLATSDEKIKNQTYDKERNQTTETEITNIYTNDDKLASTEEISKKYKPGSDTEIESTTKTTHTYNDDGKLEATVIETFDENDKPIGKTEIEYKYNNDGTVTITQKQYEFTEGNDTPMTRGGLAGVQARLLSLTSRTVSEDEAQKLQDSIKNSKTQLATQMDEISEYYKQQLDSEIDEVGVETEAKQAEIEEKQALAEKESIEKILNKDLDDMFKIFFDEGGSVEEKMEYNEEGEQIGSTITKRKYNGSVERVFVEYEPGTKTIKSMRGIEVNVTQNDINSASNSGYPANSINIAITDNYYNPNTGELEQSVVTEHVVNFVTGEILATKITTKDKDGNVVSEKEFHYARIADSNVYDVSYSDNTEKSSNETHYMLDEDSFKKFLGELDKLQSKQAVAEKRENVEDIVDFLKELEENSSSKLETAYELDENGDITQEAGKFTDKNDNVTSMYEAEYGYDKESGKLTEINVKFYDANGEEVGTVKVSLNPETGEVIINIKFNDGSEYEKPIKPNDVTGIADINKFLQDMQFETQEARAKAYGAPSAPSGEQNNIDGLAQVLTKLLSKFEF